MFYLFVITYSIIIFSYFVKESAGRMQRQTATIKMGRQNPLPTAKHWDTSRAMKQQSIVLGKASTTLFTKSQKYWKNEVIKQMIN